MQVSAHQAQTLSGDMQTADEPDFETRIEKIKAIIEKLNGNELSLKDGIKLYQEAKEHIASANQILEQAEFELKDIIQ